VGTPASRRRRARAPPPDDDDDLDAFDIATVCRRSGLGRTYVYDAINRGELVARKYGRLTRVLRSDYYVWLNGAPKIAPVGERVPSSANAGSDGHPPAPPLPASDGSHRGQPDRAAKESTKNGKRRAAAAEVI
jgi:hypothetical protein